MHLVWTLLIFSCIRPGANTCAACICSESNSPKICSCIGIRGVFTVSPQRKGAKVRIHICEGANTYLKNNSSKIFSSICASAHTGPTCTVIFEISTFLIQKHFKTVTVTVILGEINSNDFQDGNWEPMEMK